MKTTEEKLTDEITAFAAAMLEGQPDLTSYDIALDYAAVKAAQHFNCEAPLHAATEKAVKAIVAGLWNYTREKETGTCSFFAQIAGRAIIGHDKTMDLHALRDYAEAIYMARDWLVMRHADERRARVEALRARAAAARA